MKKKNSKNHPTHPRHEGQRPLGPDQQPLDDLDGPVSREVHERVERVAGGALDRKLAADERRQLRVGLDAAREVGHAPEQLRVRLLEARDRRGVGRVEHGPVGEDGAQLGERVVGVLRHAAAHPARVVRDDAADHARVDRRRVGPDLVLHGQLVLLGVAGQDGVDLAADEPRLDGHAGPVAVDLVRAEGAARVRQLEQHRVRDGLARQRGARCAEGDGDGEGPGDGEDAGDLGLGGDLMDGGVGGGEREGEEEEGERKKAEEGLGSKKKAALLPRLFSRSRLLFFFRSTIPSRLPGHTRGKIPHPSTGERLH